MSAAQTHVETTVLALMMLMDTGAVVHMEWREPTVKRTYALLIHAWMAEFVMLEIAQGTLYNGYYHHIVA